MEVVVRSVQVRRHDSDVVRSVLQVEALAHLQSRNLRDGVRFVRIFQRRSEQAVLRHRLRSLPRVDACASQEQQLLHPVLPALADHVLLNLQVLVDEVRTVVQVRHDASHVSCREHHCIRLLLIEECLYCHRVEQVQLAVRPSDQILITSLLEVVPYSRTDQSMVSGNKNL